MENEKMLGRGSQTDLQESHRGGSWMQKKNHKEEEDEKSHLETDGPLW